MSCSMCVSVSLLSVVGFALGDAGLTCEEIQRKVYLVLMRKEVLANDPDGIDFGP